MPPHRLPRIASLVALAVAASLQACSRSSPNQSSGAKSSETPAVQRSLTGPSEVGKSSTQEHNGQNQTGSPAWLEAAREDPDPRVRLHALDTWAKNPGNTFDPVTHALVDPDESVRARAQELFEEALARK